MSLFRKSLILLGLILAGLIIGQLILGGLVVTGGADMTKTESTIDLIDSMDNKMFFKIGIGLNNLFMFGLSAILFNIFITKERFLKYFNLSKKIEIKWLALSAMLITSIYPLIGYLTAWMQKLDLPDWASSMDESSMELLASLLEMSTPLDLILNLIIVAFTPAICEELLFRGVIQKEVNKYLANPHVGVLITSIIFSAVHMSIEGFPSRLLLGIVLGYSYHYTKNLWYPVLLHLFNNGIGVIVHYFIGNQIEEVDIANGPEIHWSAAIVSLAVAIAIFTVLKTKSEKDGISA